MNQAKTSMSTKLWSQISLNTSKQNTRFKAHNTQQCKDYTWHSKVLRKELVETLLVFEEKWDAVVIWRFCLETDLPCALYWWILEVIELSKAWKGSNQDSPWLELWKKQNAKWTSSWDFMLEMALKYCPDDGTMKGTRGVLRVLAENASRAKMQEGENGCFCAWRLWF